MTQTLRLLALLLLMAPVGTPAQMTTTFAPPGDHWLDWEREYENGVAYGSYVKSCGGDGAPIAHFDQTMQRIATLWAQTPGMTSSGTYGQMRAFFSMCRPINRGELSYWPWPPEDVEFKPLPGSGRIRPALKPGSEAGPLRIEVNRLGGLKPINEMNGSNINGPFGLAQKVTRQFQGYPIYDDMFMLITAAGHGPTYKPATLEDALSAWIKVGPTSGWGRTEARQLYDSLDAAGRSGPAYLYDGSSQKIVTAPGPGSDPIYRYNGDYFDKSLPPYLEIDTTPDNRNLKYPLQRRIFEATDWHRIAAELLH